MRGGSVNYGGMDDGYVPDYHTGRRISATQYQQQQYEQVHNCFVHSIFLSFGFWYFGHFSCMIFFPLLFRLAHLALQNVKKDYVIFSYFCNLVAKSDQKPKMG